MIRNWGEKFLITSTKVYAFFRLDALLQLFVGEKVHKIFRLYFKMQNIAAFLVNNYQCLV